MYLSDKVTFQTIMREAKSILEQFGVDLPFSDRKKFISRALFDLTPNEIDQRLARNQRVPFQWDYNTHHQSWSLWTRIQTSVVGVELTDNQLMELFVSVIASVIHRIEPSMRSVILQLRLGMQVIPFYPPDHCVNPRGLGNSFYLRLDRRSYNLSSYARPIFYDGLYVPTSIQQDIPSIDGKTYSLIRGAYDIAVEQAASMALLTPHDVSIVRDDLVKIRDEHLLMLALPDNEATLNALVEELITDVESELFSHSIEKSIASSESHDWIVDVDIRCDLRWHSVIKHLGVCLPDPIRFEELARELSYPYGLAIRDYDSHEFALQMGVHLMGIGRINDMELDDISNPRLSKFAEDPITFPQAIQQAYRDTMEQYRASILSRLRLLTKIEDPSELI